MNFKDYVKGYEEYIKNPPKVQGIIIWGNNNFLKSLAWDGLKRHWGPASWSRWWSPPQITLNLLEERSLYSPKWRGIRGVPLSHLKNLWALKIVETTALECEDGLSSSLPKSLNSQWGWIPCPNLTHKDSPSVLTWFLKEQGFTLTAEAKTWFLEQRFALELWPSAFQGSWLATGRRNLDLCDLKAFSPEKNTPEEGYKIWDDLRGEHYFRAEKRLLELLDAGQHPLVLLSLLSKHGRMALTAERSSSTSKLIPPYLKQSYSKYRETLSNSPLIDFLLSCQESDMTFKSTSSQPKTLQLLQSLIPLRESQLKRR